MSCVKCGEEKSPNNTATEAGKKEWYISGMCEKCFDSVTFYVDTEKAYDIYDSFVLSLVGDGCILAGGALRKLVNPSDILCDYDLFFTSEDSFSKTKGVLEESERFSKVFQCPEDKLVSYKDEGGVKVQLIKKRIYKDLLDVISSFDITACCAAWDKVSFKSNERFIFDVLHSKLNLNTVEYPVATLKRILKYSHKGYKMSSDACKEYVKMVSVMDLSDEDLEFYID